MNALVTVDITTLTPATVFAPGGVEAIVSKIEAEVSAEVFTLETAEGRERIKSVAYKVARSKTALDDMGKELVAGIKAQSAAIDAERRMIRDRLDALKESVRGPLTAWENDEAARIDGHERALVAIVESVRFDTPPASEEIRDRVATVEGFGERDWQEFSERAQAASCEAIERLDAMLTAAIKAEADAAELAELRQMKADREKADAAAAVAAQETERARQAAAAKAERDAQEAAQTAERERIRAEQQAERDRQNAERAEQEKAAAVAAAIETERRRQEQEAAAEKERQRIEAGRQAAREANKKNRAKIHAGISEAVLALILSQEDSRAGNLATVIAEAIAAGSIRNVSITY